MKRIISIIIVLILLANLGILGYLLSKQEALFIEIKYISCILEKLENEQDLLKKALLYDCKKSRKILKSWYKYWNKK